MEYLWAAILFVLNTICLFLVAVGLPGSWITLALTAGLAWWMWEPGLPWGDQMFHPVTLIALLLLAIGGELAEFFFGAAGSKKAGGSLWGAVGAIIGGVTGGIIATFLIPIPLVGSLIGACTGAFVGALAGETIGGYDFQGALRSGKGAAVGRLYGTVAKLVFAVMIWLLATGASFIP